MGLVALDEGSDWAWHARDLYTASTVLVFCGPQDGRMELAAARDERSRMRGERYSACERQTASHTVLRCAARFDSQIRPDRAFSLGQIPSLTNRIATEDSQPSAGECLQVRDARRATFHINEFMPLS
jgi:hypothetical protein